MGPGCVFVLFVFCVVVLLLVHKGGMGRLGEKRLSHVSPHIYHTYLHFYHSFIIMSWRTGAKATMLHSSCTFSLLVGLLR